MTRFDEARERLQQVTARLEAAAGAGESGPDVEALRRELADVRAENARLRQEREDTAVRLDRAVARLRSMLEA